MFLLENVAIWNAMENVQGQLRSDSERSEQRIKRASKLTGYSHDSLSKAKQIIEKCGAGKLP